MEIHQLEYLVAVAEEGGFTRAAGRLQVATALEVIDALEEERSVSRAAAKLDKSQPAVSAASSRPSWAKSDAKATPPSPPPICQSMSRRETTPRAGASNLALRP